MAELQVRTRGGDVLEIEDLEKVVFLGTQREKTYFAELKTREG